MRGSCNLTSYSVDIVKGFTKASVVVFVLMAASEVDIETEFELLRPLQEFLDHAWLIPVSVLLNKSESERAFTNLMLSHRGAERQAPSILSLGLQFSHLMLIKSVDGTHDSKMNTEGRLRSIISEFNSSKGMLRKGGVCEEKTKAILNLIVGTSPQSRELISRHLHFHKWAYCCFTSELLRSSRWLIGATPASQQNSYLKNILKVTPEIQERFLRNVITAFHKGTRKIKLTSRGKVRLGPSEWDRLVDYVCIMTQIMKDADEFLKDAEESQREHVRETLEEACLSRPPPTSYNTSKLLSLLGFNPY